MVRHNLRCDEAHKFEVWFRNEADAERALAVGEPACPICERATALADRPPLAPAPQPRAGRAAFQ